MGSFFQPRMLPKLLFDAALQLFRKLAGPDTITAGHEQLFLMVDINIRTVGDNEDTVLDKRPRKVVGSDAFEQPERTRKGLIDKLKVMVDFQLY